MTQRSDDTRSPVAGQFTGRHMAMVMVAFFAVVIGVNLIMARMASHSFTGVVVENSYVASQHFNRWLEEARRERELGWSATATRAQDGHVVVALAGAPADVRVSAVAWHPLGRAPDRPLRFERTDAGFRSDEVLPAGRWRIRIEVNAAGGRRWRTEEMVL